MFRVPTLAATGLAMSLALPASGQDHKPPVPLDGTTLSLAACNDDAVCLDVGRLLRDYSSGDERPDVLRVGIQCSPWRLYDGDGRIMPVEDLAASLRALPVYGQITRIELVCSWSSVRPDGARASLADQLAAALGKPTTGYDGFVWLGPNQTLRITHQSFTAFPNRYRARLGEFVMASAFHAMPAGVPEAIEKRKDPEGLRYVGVSMDVFHMLPDRALERFELAARYGDAIAAYNAALMRLERGGSGDAARARNLAERAAKTGDAKAAILLQQIR